MKKHFGKKLLGSVLAGAMVVTTVAAPTASAAVTSAGQATGESKVYAPTDIIDIVVPTKFKIAVNPLKVSITAADSTVTDALGLVGNTQILSGVYAIQNRSTIPVNMKVDFAVAGGAKSKANTAAGVITAENTSTTANGVFSLDLVTTAAKTAQTLTTQPTAKPDGTEGVRSDSAVESVKLGKAATQNIKLTENATGGVAAGASVNFTLDAGPYKANYDKTTDKVSYQVASNAVFDAVGFTFTGTTTTDVSKWVLDGTTGPKVTAKYTLTQMNAATYANTDFSPIWKGVPLVAKADAPGGMVILTKKAVATTVVPSATQYTVVSGLNKITFDSDALAWGTKNYVDKYDLSGVTKDKAVKGTTYSGTNLTFQRLNTAATKTNIALKDIIADTAVDVAIFGDNTGADETTYGKVTGDDTDTVTTNSTPATSVTVTNSAIDTATTGKTVITFDGQKFGDKLESLGFGYGFYQVTVGKVSTIVYYGAAALK